MASAIGTLVQDVMLPDAIVSMLGTSIPGQALPAVIFIVAAFVALSTGTSWGTMSIIFPIASAGADTGRSRRRRGTGTAWDPDRPVFGATRIVL